MPKGMTKLGEFTEFRDNLMRGVDHPQHVTNHALLYLVYHTTKLEGLERAAAFDDELTPTQELEYQRHKDALNTWTDRLGLTWDCENAVVMFSGLRGKFVLHADDAEFEEAA